tara:strand:- start:206 stop:397 length:192 start_codon:yes stop_codon:yes gene_type:complete
MHQLKQNHKLVVEWHPMPWNQWTATLTGEDSWKYGYLEAMGDTPDNALAKLWVKLAAAEEVKS